MTAIHRATVRTWVGNCCGCGLPHDDLIAFASAADTYPLCRYCQAYVLYQLLQTASIPRVCNIMANLREIQRTRAEEEAAGLAVMPGGEA